MMKGKRMSGLPELACRYGGTDEMHHLRRSWMDDAGERYAQIVADATSGKMGLILTNGVWDRA